MPSDLIDTTRSTSSKTPGIEYYKRKQFPFAFCFFENASYWDFHYFILTRDIDDDFKNKIRRLNKTESSAVAEKPNILAIVIYKEPNHYNYYC